MMDFAVELPAGGQLHLQSAQEVELWDTSLKRYREEYPTLVKMNDLQALGQLLLQQVIIYRCQVSINGMVPELDAQNVPTGRYQRQQMSGADLNGFQKALTEAGNEMRKLEKSLGIDKATRESGGAHTVDSYITELKRAAHARGIHITKRTLAFEAFVNELRWRVRMLYHSDAEDRAYHHITPRSVLDFVADELVKLEEIDKKHAREVGKLFVGRL
jgi:hypothetical protein